MKRFTSSIVFAQVVADAKDRGEIEAALLASEYPRFEVRSFATLPEFTTASWVVPPDAIVLDSVNADAAVRRFDDYQAVRRQFPKAIIILLVTFPLDADRLYALSAYHIDTVYMRGLGIEVPAKMIAHVVINAIARVEGRAKTDECLDETWRLIQGIRDDAIAAQGQGGSDAVRDADRHDPPPGRGDGEPHPCGGEHRPGGA